MQLDNQLIDKAAERLIRGFLSNHGGENVVSVRIVIALVNRQLIGAT